jgi:tripartite-type tricarboxylate transporter receptor subunit TctC
VPTFTEQGVPGMDLTSWVAIFGPAKMPKNLVAKVNAVIVKALDTQDLKDFVAKGAYEVSGSTPEEMAQEERVAYDKWGSMVKQIGFQKQ